MRQDTLGLSISLAALLLGASSGCSVPAVLVATADVVDAAGPDAVEENPAPPDVATGMDIVTDRGADDVLTDLAPTTDRSIPTDLPLVTDAAAMDVDVMDAAMDTAVDLPLRVDTPAAMDIPTVTDLGACPAGESLCGGVCVTLANDPTHCGGCATVCAFANATAGCSSGACTLGVCSTGYGNCDGVASNGCETSLAINPLHCGTCANVCMIPGATAACTAGVCTATMCMPGRGHCNGIAADGCETDLTSSVANCGVCGNACSYPHATASCNLGACALGACVSGYGNCDGVPGNGCETDLRSSLPNCGACGATCTAPADGSVSCVTGTCAVTCNAGYMLTGGVCGLIPAPQLMAPLSTAIVTRQTPTLHWRLAAGTDGAHIELSRSRAFGHVDGAFDATGSSGAPTTTLTPGVWFWRAYGRSGPSVGTVAGPVWQFTVGVRSAPFDSSYLGTTIDVNGDGYADLGVGALGAAFLYYGSASGPPASPSVTLHGPAGFFGWAVASLGDVNGDGYGDFGVSAPYTGNVLVYLGGPSGISSLASETLTQPSGITQYGIGLSAVGDVDHDGYGDLVVGTGHETAYVYRGSAAGLSTTPEWTLNGPTGSRFAEVIVGLGDVNGDGFEDIAASGGGAAAAYVFLGSAAGLTSTPSVTLTMAGSTLFGTFVVATEDVNGDGLNDLLVPDMSIPTGYSYLGRLAGFGTSYDQAIATGESGRYNIVASLGDMDHDGYSDLGYTGAQSGLSAVVVTPGGPVGFNSTTVYGLNSVARPDMRTLLGIGDVNGDGMDDCAVGNTSSYIVDLHLGGTPPHATADWVISSAGGSMFGWSVASRESGSARWQARSQAKPMRCSSLPD